RRGESVDDEGHAACSAAEDDAREPRDLEPPQLRQHVEWVAALGPVYDETPADGFDLPAPAFVVDASAAPGDLLWRHPDQRARERTRGSGVPYPHVADAEHGDAVAGELVGDGAPELETRDGLFAGHGRAVRKVACARTEAMDADAVGVREGLRHTRVDHYDPRTDLTREHIDRGAPAPEVCKHLVRDLLRVRADALLRHGVVRCHDHDGLRGQRDLRRTSDGGQGAGEVFETAEAPSRLGLGVEQTLCPLAGTAIDRADPCAGILQTCHGMASPVVGRRRTIVPSTPK